MSDCVHQIHLTGGICCEKLCSWSQCRPLQSKAVIRRYKTEGILDWAVLSLTYLSQGLTPYLQKWVLRITWNVFQWQLQT
jgi:hypothetical protein